MLLCVDMKKSLLRLLCNFSRRFIFAWKADRVKLLSIHTFCRFELSPFSVELYPLSVAIALFISLWRSAKCILRLAIIILPFAVV